MLHDHFWLNIVKKMHIFSQNLETEDGSDSDLHPLYITITIYFFEFW